LATIFLQPQAHAQTTPGNALNFDGTNDYVALPPSALNNLTTGTFETWLYLNSNTEGTILIKQSENIGTEAALTMGYYVSTGSLPITGVPGTIYYRSQNTGTLLTSNTKLQAGQWYHLALTFTATAATLYINGIADVTVNGGNFVVPNVLTSGYPINTTIGTWVTSNTPQQRLNGSLDELRVFNTDRTANINADMLNTIPGNTSGLVAYYQFNQGSAGGNNTSVTSLTDNSSAAGNGGTLTNFALTGPTSNFIESYAMAVPAAKPASGINGTSFVANWAAPAVGVIDNYYLDVSTVADFSSFVTGYNAKNIDASQLSANVTGLEKNTTYYYRVSANKASVPGQGIWSNTVSLTTLAAPPHNALNFKYPDRLVIQNPLTTDFTIEYWMNTTQVGSTGAMWYDGAGIVDGELPGVEHDLGTSLLGSKLAFGTGDPALNKDFSITSKSDVNTGRWVFVAATRNAATGMIKLFIDGIAEDSAIAGSDPLEPNSQLSLGCINGSSPYSSNGYFQGSLDEFRAFTTDRSANIQADMADTVSRTTPGLAVYYNFDQGAAGGYNTAIRNLLDQSGNGANPPFDYFFLNGPTGNFVESYAMVVPKAAQADNLTATSFTFHWAAPAEGIVDNYFWDVAKDPAFVYMVTGNSALPASTSARVTGLTPGTNYWWRVRAEKASVTGQGGFSATGKATTTLAGITSFAPASADSSTVVTIKGVGLTNITGVTFGGTPAASFTLVSDSVITAVVNGGATGSVAVIINGVTDSLPGFTYLPTSTISSFTPVRAVRFTPVIITGNNLGAATAVSFGGIPAVSFNILSNTRISALVSSGASGSVAVTTPARTVSKNGFTYVDTTWLPPGNAFSLDRYSALTAGSITLGLAGSFTIEAWVMPLSQGFTEVARSYSFVLYLTGGNSIVLGSNIYDNNSISIPFSYTPGKWYHIAYTASPAGYKVYINGVLIGGDSPAGFNQVLFNGVNFDVLAIGDNSIEHIDEFKLWKTTRSQAEVQADMVNIISQPLQQPGLLIYYNFDLGISGGDNSYIPYVPNLAGDNSLNADLSGSALTGTSSNFVQSYAMVMPRAGTATIMDSGRVAISWLVPVIDTASAYVLDLALNTNFTQPVKGYSGKIVQGTSYIVTGLQPGVTYYYRVSAYKNEVAGISLSTAIDSIKIPAAGNAPVITGFSPSPAGAGTVIVIKGSNFTGAFSVSFGIEPAESFSVVSDSVINAVVSSKGSSGSVAITGPGGYGVRAGFSFVHQPPYSALNFVDGNHIVLQNPLSTDFTIEYWMNTTEVAYPGTGWYEGAGIVDGEIGGTANDLGTSLLGNKLAFGTGDPSSAQDVTITSKSDVNTGKWVFVAATRNAATGQMKLFINGVAEDSSIAGTAPLQPNSTLTLGSINGANSNYFNGSLDEVRLFTTDRSEHILDDMGDTISRTTPGLAAYYNFDQGVPGGNNTGIDTLFDESGNGINGSLSSFPLNGPAGNFVESYAMVVAKAPYTYNITITSFTAHWTAPLAGIVENYVLDVATDPTFTNMVTGYNYLAVNGTSAVVSGLNQGTSYWWRVRAEKASVTGQSAFTKTLMVNTDGINSIWPVQAGSGTVVTILGNNLTNATAVSFGGVPAASFTVVDSATILAVVGAGASGSVAVTQPSGTSSIAGFTYLPGPVITSFTPAGAGIFTTVLITGHNLSTAGAVSFGGTPAVSFNVLSDTSITAVVGNGASGSVAVTTVAGTVSKKGFTYIDAAMPPPGNAFSFGQGGYAANNNINVNVAGSFTVEAWVSTLSVTDYTILVHSSNFSIAIAPGNILEIINSSSGLTDIPYQFTAGKWYHIAYIASPAGYNVYINGKLIAGGSPAGFDAVLFYYYSGMEALVLGAAGACSIDEVKIWKTTRSQAEVQADMTSVVNQPLQQTDLLAYYNFDYGTPGGDNTVIPYVPDLSASNFSLGLNSLSLTGASNNFVESYAMVIPVATAATGAGSNQFIANWYAPQAGIVDNYLLEVATDSGFLNIIDQYTVTGTSYTATGLTLGNTYYYRVSANKASVAGQGAYSNIISVTTTVCTAGIWTGMADNNWNNPANWCNGTVPTAIDDVVIAAGTPYQPTVSTAATVHSITNGGTLTVASAGTLSITGDVTSSGTFNASAGSIVYNGTAAQNVAGTITVKNLIINNTAGVQLYNGTTKVYGTLTPQAGTLDANGKLILASTAAGTANVATGTGNYLTGGITVERYISARRAWRMLTAPLSQTGTIYNNWQNAGDAGGDTTGAIIFKPHANGTDGYTSGGNEASMEYYDEVADNWADVPNTNATSLGNNNTSAANHAYSIFITGPYTSHTITSGVQATTLRASGLLQTGNQTFTYTPGNTHYILTGNPYASPVDMAAVVNRSTGIGQQFWMWDPNRSGTTVGGYVTFTKVGSDYINDMSGQTLQTTVLQSGEAVFTQANTTGQVSIPFTEADKTGASTSTNGVFFAPTPDASSLLRIALNRNISNTMTPVDGVLAIYNSSYNKDATDDASKLFNYDENLSLRSGNNYIAIQKAPLPQAGDSLWLDVYAMKAKSSYSFTLTPQNIPAGIQAWVVDRYLNTKTPVDLTTTSDVAFTTTTDKASYGETRFVVVFATTGTLASTLTNVKAWQQDKAVQVEWTTVTEQGVQQYNVERSPDGQSFKQIGLSAAPRNTGKTEVYDLTDNEPITGDNYYRIKIINKDATVSYSNTVVVKIEKGKPSISIYPNPVVRKQQLHITLQNMQAGKYTMMLYTTEGKQVLQRLLQYDGQTATQTINLPLSLAAGSYRLVLLDAKGNEWKQQVVVQ